MQISILHPVLSRPRTLFNSPYLKEFALYKKIKNEIQKIGTTIRIDTVNILFNFFLAIISKFSESF